MISLYGITEKTKVGSAAAESGNILEESGNSPSTILYNWTAPLGNGSVQAFLVQEDAATRLCLTIVSQHHQHHHSDLRLLEAGSGGVQRRSKTYGELPSSSIQFSVQRAIDNVERPRQPHSGLAIPNNNKD